MWEIIEQTINKFLDVDLYESYNGNNGAYTVILRDLLGKGRNFDNDCLSIFTELFYKFEIANYQKLDDGKVLLCFR